MSHNLATLAKLTMDDKRKPITSHVHLDASGACVLAGPSTIVRLAMDGLPDAILPGRPLERYAGEPITVDRSGDYHTASIGPARIPVLIGETHPAAVPSRVTDWHNAGTLDADVIRNVMRARDMDRSSPVMSGIHIGPDAIACTDGKVLISRPHARTFHDEMHAASGCVLSADMATIIVRIGGTWTMETSSVNVRLRSGPWTIEGRLVEGMFPRYAQALVDDQLSVLDLAPWIAALERMPPNPKGRDGVVFTGQGLASLADGWQARLPVAYAWPEDKVIGLMRSYIEAVDACGVDWTACKHGRGILAHGNGYRCLIMPISMPADHGVIHRIASAPILADAPAWKPGKRKPAAPAVQPAEPSSELVRLRAELEAARKSADTWKRTAEGAHDDAAGLQSLVATLRKEVEVANRTIADLKNTIGRMEDAKPAPAIAVWKPSRQRAQMERAGVTLDMLKGAGFRYVPDMQAWLSLDPAAHAWLASSGLDAPA